jgi:hypothetical protein
VEVWRRRGEVECAAREACGGLYSIAEARCRALTTAVQDEQAALKTSKRINADATRRGRRACEEPLTTAKDEQAVLETSRRINADPTRAEGEQALTGAEGDEEDDSADAKGAGPRPCRRFPRLSRQHAARRRPR